MKRVLRFGVLEDLSLQFDDEGEFIPICSYEKHRGIIKDRCYATCVQRGCTHLKKYRPEDVVLYRIEKK